MKISAIAGLLVAGIVTACGGGGGGGNAHESAAGPPATLTQPPREVLYGYYGHCDTCSAETHRHVNMIHVPNWGPLETTVRQLTEARVYGIKHVMLGVPQLYHAPDAERALREFFTTLRGANLLTNITALYPLDEPDLHSIPADVISARNALLRRVMAEFPELRTTKLAVIYTSRPKWPGIDSYDWVGFDDYGAGSQIFTNGLYSELKDRLRPDQRVLLVPGGADPWRQDPEPFIAKALEDPQVIGVVPFIWYDFADREVGRGIRSNGLAGAYCEAARKLTKSTHAC